MFQVRLKELREKAGLSQNALAKQLGFAQSTVGMWESGKNKPEYDTLTQIADFFNVSTDYLTGREKEKTPVEDEGRFKEGELIRLDADSMEILRAVRERPDMKILFSVTKNVTPEDLKKAIKIVEAFKEDSENM